MSRVKRILVMLLVGTVAIQFIRPARNNGGQDFPADITKQFDVPINVQLILKTSCSDCHSNKTRYPWYSNIQPIGWFLANHVNAGKRELNFNEFVNYPRRRQLSKLKAISNSVKNGSMPLSSYTIIHNDAKLSEENKTIIVKWATRIRGSLQTN